MVTNRIVGSSVFLLGLVPLLAACATTVPLSRETKSSIRSVSINNEVGMPRGNWGHSDCPVSAATVRAMLNDLGQIIREQFESSVKAAGVFPSVLPEGGDAQFRLSMAGARILYAGPYGGPSGACKPGLAVEGILRAPDGSVLWQKSVTLSIFEKRTPKRGYRDYDHRPGLIREDFMIAAQVAVEELVHDMINERQ